jgi:hypothetical protein
MFIKHSDGKIVSVIEEEELTEAQKKTAKDLSKNLSKFSWKSVNSGDADTSSAKKSGS